MSIAERIEKIRETVGNSNVLCALSGGVDSSVVAALIGKAVGSQLHCVFVDHGFMRKDEPKEIHATFSPMIENFTSIDARERFLDKVKGVTDPETKRKRIGEEFIRVFEEHALTLPKIEFLAQGTIYPDVVESGVDGEKKVVKSHHNVGGLPEKLGLKLLEPLIDLYKEDVRKLGLELGLPEQLVRRQPFPGPGLAIRVIGEITREKLDTLREVDAIFRDEMQDFGAKQYFAIITDTKSVGVRAGERSYEYVIALRSISTNDFMEATFTRIPFEKLEQISKRITDEVQSVNRVVYDITNKPPSTIEWE